MLIKRKHRKRITRVIVSFLLLSILNQVIAPTVAFALTSGPTSPEATSFEPIDTTDMVNPLTGDFTYNLPLLEVPGPEGGYPLSLSYHAGIQPNEDASWVGLGWTLNPGAITRSVNGFPDDWSGTNVSRRDYWDGGLQTTYNIGVSVGFPGPVGNVSFGLAFSQDTYRGFGVGMNIGVGVGLGLEGTSLSLGIGKSPYGDAYVSAGLNLGVGSSSGISGSIGLGLSTNFESISADVYGSLNYKSLIGTSMSTNSGGPSFSVGGISSHTENSNAGKISTSSSGFSFNLPVFPGINLGLAYSKVRYWSDETSNTHVSGSLKPTPIISSGPVEVPDNLAYDNYGLLDSAKNIIVNSDPGKVQGGAFPDFDVYSVSSQGLSGNIRPYVFQSQIFSQNRKNADNVRLLQYFQTKNNSFSLFSEYSFRFVNDFSNSYRQTYPNYSSGSVDLKTTEPPFDPNPQYGNNDGNFGYSAYNNNLAGSKSIEVYTKDVNGIISKIGFVKPKVNGLNRSLHKSNNSHIEGFKITNASGVTYHYNLPAYSYEEEVFQKKISGNSSNKQKRTEGYAYTWYLTSITGPDYVDKNNNNELDEGDWGYWVNFEYGKWSDNYVWRNPPEGYHRDEDIDFQDFSMGKKEIYYLNAIRTRSHIALFEKDIRLDARGASPAVFVPGGQNGYHNFNGLFDENSAKSMKLSKIYLLNATDAALITPSSSGTAFYANVLDKGDVEAVGRNNLEAKSIRVIDFNHNYSLCKGTTNSFSSSGNTEKFGKLTLSSLIFRGTGGSNLTPPIEFDYGLNESELKTGSAGISSNSGSNIIVSDNGAFQPGDLIETDESNAKFCGAIVSKVQNGNSFTYTCRNGQYFGSPVTKQIRNTKNPPYNKDACDMWGMYKSDYVPSNNVNLSKVTTDLSNKSVDVWCLRKIKTNLGSEIVVDYEGDTYSKSVVNQSLSMIITQFTRVNDTSWMLNINTEGKDLSQLLTVGQVLNFTFLTLFSNPPWVTTPYYRAFTTSSVAGAGSDPIIESVSSNSIQVKVKSNLANILGGYANQVFELKTGNLKFPGMSRYYGGGIRVKSLQTDNLLDTKYLVKYSYNNLDNNLSSGVTSCEPGVLDIDDTSQYGSYATSIYRFELYKKADALYSMAREIPPPGVMYEYVTVQNEVHRPGQSMPLPVEGKMVYQYEVFRDNMVGSVEVSPAQTGSANGKSQYTKNIALKKFIGSLGALKKYVKYDINGHKLSETINHYLHDGLESLSLTDFMNQYEQRLQVFNYQGLIKERYSEVKEVRQNDGSYHILGTFSAKEELPVVPLGQTTKDYVTGIETGTENLAFDFYSGASTKTVSKDAYGNRFLTEIEPAYRKYSAMGLKAMNTMYVSFSNMLTQQASKTIYKVNSANQPVGVVSASAQTWSNGVQVDDENGDPTSYGQANIWRSKATHQWMMPGVSNNNITPIGLFTPFNHAGSSSSSWKKTGEITRYNVYSAALEATDINNHYAASKMGYKNSKVTVSASPARHMEIAYTGAEDAPLPNGKLSTGISLGSGSIDNSIAHTGSKSVSLAAGATGVTYQVALSDLDPARRDYQLAVWVKSSGDVSGARLFYQVDNQTAQLNSPSFQKTAAGWYLLEMRIPASALASGTNLMVGCKNVGGQAAINFDDFRFQPFNAPTSSYVYDNFTGQPTYILDNNNLYVKYEYDAIGRLVKVYKEVLGKQTIPVVKEIAYNYAKPVATISNPVPFYARVEINNYNYVVPGDEYNTEELYGDVYVKFYSDAGCTVPYTLPVSMDFDVNTLTTWNNFHGAGTQTGSYLYNVPDGASYFFIGNMNISVHKYWDDPYYGNMWDDIFIDYSLVPYVNSPYISLPTLN